MDIMLDLETLGTKPGCAVLAIGAKVFDPYGDDSKPIQAVPPAPLFYRNIDLFSSLMIGLTIDPATVEWWRKQDKDAQKALQIPATITPQKAVEDFDKWYSGLNQARAPSDLINIWAKSPGFDCHVWEHVAALVMSVPLLWDFRRFRDVRTAISMSGIDEKAITAKGTGRTQHNALDDCDVQILQVQAAYRMLKPVIPLQQDSGENPPGIGLPPSLSGQKE